jgi:hypothetical protein
VANLKSATHFETGVSLEMQFEDPTILQLNVRCGRTQKESKPRHMPGDVRLAAQMRAHMQKCNTTLGRGALPQAHKVAQALQQI